MTLSFSVTEGVPTIPGSRLKFDQTWSKVSNNKKVMMDCEHIEKKSKVSQKSTQ